MLTDTFSLSLSLFLSLFLSLSLSLPSRHKPSNFAEKFSKRQLIISIVRSIKKKKNRKERERVEEEEQKSSCNRLTLDLKYFFGLIVSSSLGLSFYFCCETWVNLIGIMPHWGESGLCLWWFQQGGCRGFT